MWKILGPIWTVRDSVGNVLGVCVVNCVINCVLVSRRPEMGMEFGPIKWNRCWVSGLPMDSPLFYFWTVKSSPGFCEMDQKGPCVGCLKLKI